MTTEYKKAQRAAVNKAFAEKQAKLGLKSYRFSLPEACHDSFAALSEKARADYYAGLARDLPDGAVELEIMAESNRTSPLTEAQLEAANNSGLEGLIENHKGHFALMESSENAALAAQEAGDTTTAIRQGAHAFVAASYLRIYKNQILAALKEPLDN